jgi:Ni,Fe-hydrogenase III large subunit
LLTFETATLRAGQSCPICANAHVLACCQAIEALSNTLPPPRATYLRVALAEIERAASHLGILAALFTQLGLTHDGDRLQTSSTSLYDTLAMLDAPTLIIPGGLAADIPSTQTQAIREEVDQLSNQIFKLAQRAINRRGILSRTIDIGVLSPTAAAGFGVTGPLARASGMQADTRKDEPYAAYADLKFEGIIQADGDVYARLIQLLLETLESCKLADQALAGAPQGNRLTDLNEPVVQNAMSVVEAPRGPLRYQVILEGSRIGHLGIATAPQLDRLLARSLLRNALVDDAALILCSTDPCSYCAGAHTGLH